MKNGGHLERTTLVPDLVVLRGDLSNADWNRLDDVLDALERRYSERRRLIADLCIFGPARPDGGGPNFEAIGDALGLCASTVRSEWAFIRKFLIASLS